VITTSADPTCQKKDILDGNPEDAYHYSDTALSNISDTAVIFSAQYAGKEKRRVKWLSLKYQ
jgi:hypothetical protein